MDIINYLWWAFIAFMGLFFGSFANVLIYRIKHGGSLWWGRSHCPSCHHVLKALDLVPLLSFVFLKRKCRYCQQKISYQYFVVELLFSVVWFIMAINLGFPATFYQLLYDILLLVIVSLLLTIAIYDFFYTEIPDILSIACMHVIMLILFLPMGHSVLSSILGAFFIYTFFYLQILIPSAVYALKNHNWQEIKSTLSSYFIFPLWFSLLLFLPSKIINKIPLFKDEDDENSLATYWIGGGDLRLAFVMGALLGLKGAVVSLFVAYLLGALLGIVLIIYNKNNAKKMIPFGPFLVIGTFIALFWSEILWAKYWALIF